MSTERSTGAERGAGWNAILDACADGVSASGIRLVPAREADCLVLAPAVAVRHRNARGALAPAEALAGLVRRRVILSAYDESGAIVGLATIRPYLGDPLVGWAVLPDRTGHGMGGRIASAAVAMALSAGARNVWCEVGVRNLPAVSTLDDLGFRVELAEPSLPSLCRVDGTSFTPFVPEPRPIIPNARTMERCAPLHPEDWVRRAPTARDILSVPMGGEAVSLRLAGPGDEDALVALAPFGVVPSGDAEGVRAFLRAMMGIQVVLMGTGPDGNVVGSVTLGRNSLGRHEIGWVVDAPARGNGYATDMARAVLARLLDEGIDAVDCSIDSGNLPSLAVAAKLGFEVSAVSDAGVVEMTVDPATFAPSPSLRSAMAA